MTATRINRRPPAGYDTSRQVNLLNYTSANPYTAPDDGIVRITASYRGNAYTICHIRTGANDLTFQSSMPSSGGVGNVIQSAQVFAGQELWAERNPNIAYGGAEYIPYAY